MKGNLLTKEQEFYIKIYLNKKNIRKKITEFGIVSKHNPYQNQRESTLYILDLMIKKINQREKYNYNIDEHLLVDSEDLLKIINSYSSYITYVSNQMKENGYTKEYISKHIKNLKDKKNIEKLNYNEIDLIKSAIQGYKMEYVLTPINNVIGFDAVRVTLEAVYKAIIRGVETKDRLSIVNMYIGENLSVKDIKFKYDSNKNNEKYLNPNQKVTFWWNKLEEYDDKKADFKAQYHSLSNNSINNLCTIKYMIYKYNNKKDKENLNYMNFAKNYFDILKNELILYLKIDYNIYFYKKNCISQIDEVKDIVELKYVLDQSEFYGEDIFGDKIKKDIEAIIKFYYENMDKKFLSYEKFKELENLIYNSPKANIDILEYISNQKNLAEFLVNLQIIIDYKGIVPKEWKYKIKIIKDVYFNDEENFFEPGKTRYIFMNMVKEIGNFIQSGF